MYTQCPMSDAVVPLTVKAAKRLFAARRAPEAMRSWPGGILACATHDRSSICLGVPGDKRWLIYPVSGAANGAAVVAMANAGIALGYTLARVAGGAPVAASAAAVLRRHGWAQDPHGWRVRVADPEKSLRVELLDQKRANEWVDQHHSHLGPSRGSMFSVGVFDHTGDLHCVAQVGIPRARMLLDGFTAEVVRVASDRTRNAASLALGACWRACSSVGYKRLVSYTLLGESGVSYTAAGWRPTRLSGGGQWSRDGRERASAKQPDPKVRWEVGAGDFLSEIKELHLRTLIRERVGRVQFKPR